MKLRRRQFLHVAAAAAALPAISRMARAQAYPTQPVHIVVGYAPGGPNDIAARLVGARRADVLPDIPTIGDFVPGYEASGWTGIGAPRSTPTEIIDKLNSEINAGLADPNIKAQLADLGNNALALSPAEFGRLLAKETEKWGKVVRAAGMKPE